MVRGIAAYRRHPWQRDLSDPPAIWAEGAARLLDYGAGQERAGEPVVVFVPSLINRAYILDLMADRSLMRWLAGRGVRPLLLDWGWPGSAERRFTLTDHVAGRLERALLAVAGPVILAGYCMGGTLALAAALRRPDRVRALALLAAPWDFHADAPPHGLPTDVAALEASMAHTGTLPIDAIQALFAAADPGAIGDKYRAFGRLDQDSDAALRFVALEDWLNDGIPLAAPVARETLCGWYGDNATARGEWRVAGEPVRPERLSVPCFVAVPARDRIVPPASALALAAMIPAAVVHRPPSGHIGMVAGARAEAGLWTPLLDWMLGGTGSRVA